MHNNLLRLLVVMTVVLGYAQADPQETATHAGKSLASDLGSDILNMVQNPNSEDIPQYPETPVPEEAYYGMGLEIENEALLNSTVNPTADFVTEGKNSRPHFELNPDTDTLFQQNNAITASSLSLIDTYSSCVSLSVGVEASPTSALNQCFVTAHRDLITYSCERRLDVTCSNEDAGQPWPYLMSDFTISGDSAPQAAMANDRFSFGSRSDIFKGMCVRFTKTIRFYIPDISLMEARLEQIEYDDWLDIWINSRLIFRGIGPQQDISLSGEFPCEMKQNYSAPTIDIRNSLRQGWNTLHLVNLVGGNGTYYLELVLQRIAGCDEVETTTYNCPAQEQRVIDDLMASTCLDSGWRQINGVPIYRACWTFKDDYSRLSFPVYQQDLACEALEVSGCGQVASSCVVQGDGYCQSSKLTYSCPESTSSQDVDICGDLLSCPDGDCATEYKVQKDATEDFKAAATGMAVASEVAGNFNFDDLSVFTGAGKSCRKQRFGFVNCCSDSGWGVNLNLAQCKSSEIELGYSREQKAAHYIGSYDSGGIFDRRTYRVFCTYPSKLARIIVEQGNAQLGRGYGSASNPVCNGFSVEELNGLSIETLNLAEFYEDLAVPNMSIDPNQLIEDIQDRLNQMGGN